MKSEWDDPEPFQYMMEVDNGWVHGLEWSPDKSVYGRNDLQTQDKAPETILKATESHEYDFEYSEFSNGSVSADKVGIDAVNGIIDVHRNGEVIDQYSLVGILRNDEDRPELVFGGIEENEEGIAFKSDNEIQWNPNLAAAYEAVYESIDFERELEEERVPLYSPEETESSISSLDNPKARRAVKRIDDFIRGLSDPAMGISDFESNGNIKINKESHYGSSRGYHAARSLKSDLNRLRSAGLIGYGTEPLSKTGDEKEVDLEIASDFLDGKGSLSDDVRGLSDFDVDSHKGRKNLTEERMD